MGEGITNVALDAHKKFLQVAMLLPKEVKAIEWQVVHEDAAVRRMAKRILREVHPPRRPPFPRERPASPGGRTGRGAGRGPRGN